jgi:hypothetical protein
MVTKTTSANAAELKVLLKRGFDALWQLDPPCHAASRGLAAKIQPGCPHPLQSKSFPPTQSAGGKPVLLTKRQEQRQVLTVNCSVRRSQSTS